MEVDWTASMTQTFEYYVVDPNTWKDDCMLENVISCTIDRDATSSTLASATIDCSSVLDECYVRIYLIVIQNGYRNRFPLGTFLVQTPTISFNGKRQEISMDAYSPLIELKDKLPEIGYTSYVGDNIMTLAIQICKENLRAPVIDTEDSTTLEEDFVADTDDSWLDFLTDYMENANYVFDLDENGRVLFSPVQDAAALQPMYEFTDDNSSILYPDVEDEQDLYDIPNVVEVIYSNGTGYVTARVVNDDENSPISTVSRGREVVYRDTNPSVLGEPNEQYLTDYATALLRSKSCLEHKITFKHGYCGVRVNDCVMLNYKRAGFNGIKAKIQSQTITCETGCPVESTAVYTNQLWG